MSCTLAIIIIYLTSYADSESSLQLGSKRDIPMPTGLNPHICSVAWDLVDNYQKMDYFLLDQCDTYFNITTSNTIQCIHFKRLNLTWSYAGKNAINYWRNKLWYYFDIFIQKSNCSKFEYVGHTQPRFNQDSFISNDTFCIKGATKLWVIALNHYSPTDWLNYNTPS
eukprot:452876_1